MKHLLASGIQFAWYRNPDTKFVAYFFKRDYWFILIVFLLLMKTWVQNVMTWKLFRDSSKQRLKEILLHNSNQYASVSIIAHLASFKKEDLALSLNKVSMKIKTGNFLESLKLYLLLSVDSQDIQHILALYVSGIAEYDNYTK